MIKKELIPSYDCKKYNIIFYECDPIIVFSTENYEELIKCIVDDIMDTWMYSEGIYYFITIPNSYKIVNLNCFVKEILKNSNEMDPNKLCENIKGCE